MSRERKKQLVSGADPDRASKRELELPNKAGLLSKGLQCSWLGMYHSTSYVVKLNDSDPTKRITDRPDVVYKGVWVKLYDCRPDLPDSSGRGYCSEQILLTAAHRPCAFAYDEKSGPQEFANIMRGFGDKVFQYPEDVNNSFVLTVKRRLLDGVYILPDGRFTRKGFARQQDMAFNSSIRHVQLDVLSLGDWKEVASSQIFELTAALTNLSSIVRTVQANQQQQAITWSSEPQDASGGVASEQEEKSDSASVTSSVPSVANVGSGRTTPASLSSDSGGGTTPTQGRGAQSQQSVGAAPVDPILYCGRNHMMGPYHPPAAQSTNCIVCTKLLCKADVWGCPCGCDICAKCRKDVIGIHREHPEIHPWRTMALLNQQLREARAARLQSGNSGR